MEKVSLRGIWKNEAKDFSSWLYDNLDVLSEELELKLKLQKMHCKLFHRQKFMVWISSCWWKLYYKLNNPFKHS